MKSVIVRFRSEKVVLVRLFCSECRTELYSNINDQHLLGVKELWSYNPYNSHSVTWTCMAIITCEMIILYDFYTYTIIKKFTWTEIFKMLFSNIFHFSYPTFFSFIFQFSLTKISSYYWVIFFGLSYFTFKHHYSFIFQLAPVLQEFLHIYLANRAVNIRF